MKRESDLYTMGASIMRRWMSALAVVACICTPVAHAQDGSFDPGFGNGGALLVDVSSGTDDKGQVMHLESGGKILMAGTCMKSETIGGHTDPFPKFCATRLRADGSYDTSFGPGGVGYIRFDRFESIPGGNFPHNSQLADMVRLNDGRILFMGRQTDPGIFMAVLTSDGSALDPGVGNGAGFITSQFGADAQSVGTWLLVQPDGKILVSGVTIGPNGNDDMAIKRFLPDLSVDTSFGNDGYQTVAFDLGGPSGDNSDAAVRIALQNDGRILLSGNALVSTSPPRIDLAFARLLANGQLDPDFGPNHDGRAHFPLRGYNTGAVMQVDRHGRINYAGTTIDVTTSAYFCVVDRLLGDGSQDPSFNPGDGSGHPQEFAAPYDGSAHNCAIADMDVQADGTIFAAGEAYHGAPGGASYFVVAKLKPGGGLDSSFGLNGLSYGQFGYLDANDFATSIAIGNGGLMVGGYGTDLTGANTGFGIARLTLDDIFKNGFDD
ncbi:MAG TPA: hypothetical protein VFN13_11010 [Rudaea sp.]|nr:hypothetical protein [Rudaea sp.]